jgi:hypothetical protein
MFGWYDGVTSGMARCRVCGCTYFFAMLAWDDEREMRIYGFKEISQRSYESFMATQSRSSPDAENHDDLLALRDALATSMECLLYIAATDLTRRIDGFSLLTFASWAELLRLK